MRHPITGRRISKEKYDAQQAAFAKRIAEMNAEEQAANVVVNNPKLLKDALRNTKALGNL
jgi:hypothetical protein